MKVPTVLTGGPNQEMTLWSGVIDDQNNLTWKPIFNGEVFVEGDQYFAIFQDFG